MKKFFKVVGLFILGLIGLFVLIGVMSGGESTSSSTDTSSAASQPAEPPMMVTAKTLVEDYKGNEVAADQKYKGKILEVSGKIASIDSSIGDKAIVRLVGLNEFETVSLSGNAEFTQYAATLNKGQNITLICKGDGEVIGMPQLSNCKAK